MVCRGDLSDITGPLHHGGLGGPDSSTLPPRRGVDRIFRRRRYRVSGLTPQSDEKWRNVVGIGQLGCERTCSTEKENLMASPTTFRSPYVQRLELVRDPLTSHSKLEDKAASELAEHVLHGLNSIPETVR